VCGRATLTNEDVHEVARELGAEIAPDDAIKFRPRYNVAPSDLHWIVQAGPHGRLLVPAVWGYLTSPPPFSRGRSQGPSHGPFAGRPIINVRGEQVGSGRTFREAFQARRCLMITDGFFEWDNARSPFWFHRADGGLVLLAGLYQRGGLADKPQDKPEDKMGPSDPERFTILTTRPNQVVARVHDRMPVMISPSRIDPWLSGQASEIIDLIAPAPEQTLLATPVSRRVNAVKNDDPACLAPLTTEGHSERAATKRQLTLF